MSDTPEARELVVVEERRPTTLTVKETMDQLDSIRQLVAQAMKPDHDYGVIPGTNNKRVMLLPGAQKTAMYFNCSPEYDVKKTELPNGHCEIDVTCSLVSRANGRMMGQGVGSCSTMESKYRWRKQSRKCPNCEKETIIKGRQEYGGGWLCWKKKGGCGSQFLDNDNKITDQPDGRTENEDIADARNTVLKMAKKRALVDAALGLGCMAELFTQDIEPEERHEEPEPPITGNRKFENQKPEPVTLNGLPLPGDNRIAVEVAWFTDALAKGPTQVDLNGWTPRLKQMQKDCPPAFSRVWPMVTKYAIDNDWRYDNEKRQFVSTGERRAQIEASLAKAKQNMQDALAAAPSDSAPVDDPF